MKFIAVLALVPFMSGAAFAESAQGRLERLLSKYESEKNLSGHLTVLVDGRVYQGGAGPYQSDTLFSLASNSKQFVAAGILKLEEEGLLKTGDPVSSFFPELDPNNLSLNGKAILIEHLLQNTSGLASPENDPVLKAKFMREEIKIAEVLNGLRGLALTFEPGSKFEYMDINFVLGGEIIRRVSGLSYADFLARRLFIDRIDTANIQVDNKLNSERIARSREWKDGAWRDYMRERGFLDGQTNDDFADGNIFATSHELARWTGMLIAGRVLSEESLAKMFRPSKASSEARLPYGYAWNIRACESGDPVYFHDGGFNGYASRMLVFPRQKTSVIWLSNSPEINESFMAEVLTLFSLTVKWDGCEGALTQARP